jgi:hypothetical protein
MDSAKAPFQYYCQLRGNMIIFPLNMQLSWHHCIIEEREKKLHTAPHYTMLLLDWCLFIIFILKEMAYLERKDSCCITEMF